VGAAAGVLATVVAFVVADVVVVALAETDAVGPGSALALTLADVTATADAEVVGVLAAVVVALSEPALPPPLSFDGQATRRSAGRMATTGRSAERSRRRTMAGKSTLCEPGLGRKC